MATLDVARGVALASTAIAVGALAFLLVAWLPALRGASGGHAAFAGGEAGVTASADAFAARLATLLLGAAAAGLVAAFAVLLLEDHSTREQAAWLAAAGAWVVLAGVVAARPDPGRMTLRSPAAIAALAASGVLVLVPGLAGNAATQGPAWLVVAANAAHVLAASAWIGGIACLLVAVPPALRPLPAAEQATLLPEVAARFSATALLAVIALALTGVLQAALLVGRVEALATTGYGRLVMIKGALLCLLALAGVAQRSRILPALRAAADRLVAAGDGATALRRLLIGEAVLLALVLAATAVLAGTAPPSGSTQPVRVHGTLGELGVTLTARPGSPGPNRLTIDLRGRGARDLPARLAVSARQPRLGLGPISLRAIPRAGGRFVVEDAMLSAPGSWTSRCASRAARARPCLCACAERRPSRIQRKVMSTPWAGHDPSKSSTDDRRRRSRPRRGAASRRRRRRAGREWPRGARPGLVRGLSADRAGGRAGDRAW